MPWRHLRAGAVEAVERTGRNVPEELRPIGEQRGAKAVEDLERQAAGIGGRLDHERRHRADEDRLGHATLRAAGAVAADVARDLAAARRVPDVDGVLQVERLGERDEVVGVGVHLVAVPGLGRSPVSAAVVGDAAKAARREEDHLGVPVVRAERPAVAEDDGLPAAPVLVVDLRAVLRGDRAHGMFSLVTGLRGGLARRLGVGNDRIDKADAGRTCVFEGQHGVTGCRGARRLSGIETPRSPKSVAASWAGASLWTTALFWPKMP